MYFGDIYTLIAHFNLDDSYGVEVGMVVGVLSVSVETSGCRCLGQRFFV